MVKRFINYFFRNYWEKKLYLYRLLPGKRNVPVNKPIFLLGTQGGGLTFISRMLRQHSSLVSVTGNYKYFAGRDELQNELYRHLPEKLRLGNASRDAGIIEDDDKFGKKRGWIYACNDLVDNYRATAEDFTEQSSEIFLRIIKDILGCYSINENSRFIDKSQVFTIKTLLIRKIIPDSKFVLVTRDPYVMVLRGAKVIANKTKERLSFEERLDLACQHWHNSFSIALSDLKDSKSLFLLNYEEFLNSPEQKISELTEFLELEGKPEELLPQSNKLPRGSISEAKWYPIRTDINDRYYRDMTVESLDFIESKIGDLALKLGYRRPELNKS